MFCPFLGSADVEDFYRQCDPGKAPVPVVAVLIDPILTYSLDLTVFSRLPEIAEKENLCLYGFPDENWEVNLPAEEVPPELPEPALGINFARDGMQKKDWLALVAVHSDAWLLAVAFYYGARFDKNERSVALPASTVLINLPCVNSMHIVMHFRKRLFNLINDLPTLFDIVTGKKPATEKPAAGANAGPPNKGKAAGKAVRAIVKSGRFVVSSA